MKSRACHHQRGLPRTRMTLALFIYFGGRSQPIVKKKKITFDSVTLYKYAHTRNRYKNFTKQQIPLVHAMSSYVSVLFYFF